MVAAADLNRHLDVDDRLFVLHVNAVDNAAMADCGDMSVTDEIEQSVNGKWQPVFQDLPAELPPERNVFHHSFEK